MGHQYAPDALESEQRATIDSALWSAVRVLEEHADLKGRLAQRAAANGLEHVSEGFAERGARRPWSGADDPIGAGRRRQRQPGRSRRDRSRRGTAAANAVETA
jgi:hypothetical protein